MLRLLTVGTVLLFMAACGGVRPKPAPLVPPPLRAVPLPEASLVVSAEPVAAGLLIPVAGVAAEQLRDTYREDREGGRTHNAIDIPAPHGTAVVAAADGTVVKLHAGSRGGNAIYQLAPDGFTRYYYAHLDRYADDLVEGRFVRRGEIIGYVGDTGNATPGDFHLHFSVALLADPDRWWEGINLNPFPLLRGGGTP